jgi:hypothetical protein
VGLGGVIVGEAALVGPVDGPVGETGGVIKVEFGTDVGAVGVDGVHGEVEAFGDQDRGEAVADEEEDFALTDGEELDVGASAGLGGKHGRVRGIAGLSEGLVEGGGLGVDDGLDLLGAKGGGAVGGADAEETDYFLAGVKQTAGAELDGEDVLVFVLVEDAPGPAAVLGSGDDGVNELIGFVGDVEHAGLLAEGFGWGVAKEFLPGGVDVEEAVLLGVGDGNGIGQGLEDLANELELLAAGLGGDQLITQRQRGMSHGFGWPG